MLRLLILAGCGGDDDPVAPIVIPATDDIPETPPLSSAYVDPPIRSESIALTLGAEVGGSFEGFSAKVSTSLTTTFSTTVTVSQSTTTSFTRTLEGIEGKRSRFVLWVLRERYSFANEEGIPFTDENYDVEKGIEDPITGKFYTLEISGGQAEATKYIFDLKSEKLLDTVTMDDGSGTEQRGRGTGCPAAFPDMDQTAGEGAGINIWPTVPIT